MKLVPLVPLAGSIVVALAAFGPPWIALAYNSFSYPTTGAGEAGNVVMHGRMAYATLAERGFEVLDASDGRSLRVVPPPAGSGSIDDLAVADGFLFVLDARPPGHLSAYSLRDPARPELAGPPVAVPVGPFSGVTAAAGKVIVSGGTSSLSVRSYDGAGRVGPEVAALDLGRGQPDVLLAPDGRRAFVSTHRWGPYFALAVLEVGPAGAVSKRGSVDLETFGFTAGGAKPASFPIECALAESYLLVAHAAGLAVLSIEDPEHAKLTRVVDVGVEAVNVDVEGGLAAVVGSSPKPLLVLLDVRAPALATVARTIALPEGSLPTGVAIGPDAIAVAAGRRGVLLYPRQAVASTVGLSKTKERQE